MKGTLSGLESLRAIGAMMVLLFHLSYAVSYPEYLSIIRDYFGGGVQLFFVLSAFSIYYGYYDGLNDKEEIKNYLVRRFLRIAPVFYLILAIMALLSFFGGPSYSILEYLVNITFIFNFFPSECVSIVAAGWAIGVLFIFYLLVPILIPLIRRIKVAFISLIVILFLSSYYYNSIHSISGIPVYFSSISIITQLPFFIMGIFCFLLIRGRLEKKNRDVKFSMHQRIIGKVFKETVKKNIHKLHSKEIEKVIKNMGKTFLTRMPNIIGLGLILFAILLTSQLMWPSPLKLLLGKVPYINAYYYIWGFVFCCLIVGFILYPCRLYVNRVTKFIGDRSYSVYLIHPLVLVFLAPFYTVIYEWIADWGLAFLISFLFTLLIVLFISSLVYKFIEQPAMKYGISFILKKKSG